MIVSKCYIFLYAILKKFLRKARRLEILCLKIRLRVWVSDLLTLESRRRNLHGEQSNRAFEDDN
jgi:hypothetical protein